MSNTLIFVDRNLPEANAPRTLLRQIALLWGILWITTVILIHLSPQYSGRNQRYNDAKLFYVSGRLLLQGQNPYDAQLEKRESLIVDPDSYSPTAGIEGKQILILLPGTLPLLAVASLLPLQVFYCLLTGVSTLCIPLICILVERINGRPLTLKRIALGTVCFAIIPCTWQTLVLGQTGILMTCAFLFLLSPAESSRAWSLVATITLLVKTTFSVVCLPLALVRKPGQRVSMCVAAIIFTALAGFTVADIGWDHFSASYHHNISSQLQEGGTNDPHGAGRMTRLDLEPLVYGLVDNVSVGGETTAYGCLMLVIVVSVGLQLAQSSDALRSVSLASLLTLTFPYHRTYDAVLLAPAWAYAINVANPKSSLRALLYVCSVVALAALLASRPVNLTDFPLVRPFLTLTSLVLLSILPDRQAGGAGWRGHHLQYGGKPSA